MKYRFMQAAALCTAFAITASAAPAATEAGGKKFEVILTGLVVQPSGKSMPRGEDIEVKEHDVILDGKLSWFSVAKLEAATTVKAVDTEFPVSETTNLRLAARANGGDLASLPAGAKTYCDELRTDRMKALGQLATLGLSALGSRLSKETQVCLVDSDSNGDFDKAFIVGTKKAPDRHLVELAPVKYTKQTLAPLEGDSSLRVKFYDGGVLSGPSLGMELKINGGTVNYASLYMFPLNRFGGGTPVPFRPNSGIKEKKLPQTHYFAFGQVVVKAFDKQRKVGTINITRDIVPSGFVIQYPPQVIYIYY